MYVPPTMFYLIAAAFALTAVFLILSGIYHERSRRRPKLAERSRSCKARSVAEEAQAWLRRQG